MTHTHAVPGWKKRICTFYLMCLMCKASLATIYIWNKYPEHCYVIFCGGTKLKKFFFKVLHVVISKGVLTLGRFGSIKTNSCPFALSVHFFRFSVLMNLTHFKVCILLFRILFICFLCAALWSNLVILNCAKKQLHFILIVQFRHTNYKWLCDYMSNSQNRLLG